MKSSVIDVMPHILSKVRQETGTKQAASSTACIMLVLCLAYSSVLKIEVTCSSEISVLSRDYKVLYATRQGFCLVACLNFSYAELHFRI
jgi:hypothetical protein